MIRLLAATSLVAMAGFALAGCARPGPGRDMNAASAPYSYQTITNPNCGIYGTCEARPSRQFQPYEFYGGGY